MWTLLLACTDPPATEPPLETEGTLSVLTYNVQGLPDALTDSDRPNTERMSTIAPLLDDYDLVGLQEDFDPDNHALLTDTRHTGREWFDATVAPERIYGAGLALLTRTETVDYVETHYTDCNGILDGSSDCLASKGFQQLTISLGGVEVDLINTHHEAGGGTEDDAARRAQVLQVIDAIDAHPDRAVLFMGDTNLRPSDPDDVDELALYADAGLLDACEAVGCSEPDHIDRFLLRDAPGLTFTVDSWSNDDPTFTFPEGDPMSDHPPIAITVSWQTD